MRDWDMGWAPKPPENAALKPRLERARSELPRGGKDMASQIGAELRIVFGPPAPTELGGTELGGLDEVLAQIDKGGLG